MLFCIWIELFDSCMNYLFHHFYFNDDISYLIYDEITYISFFIVSSFNVYLFPQIIVRNPFEKAIF